jgi:RNA polymerase sigma-70 factor (ECF subfamily)
MGFEHDEADWIRQGQAGDPEALGALVERYQRMVHALTFRMTGSMTDAEDLAQETFLQAFRRLDTFRGEAKFSSWLCQIAINTCLNWSKREKRRDEVQRLWAENEAILGEGRVEAADAEAPITRRVTAGLMRLPTKQRAAVVLTVYEGLNHAQAAQILGCSETTVSWRLFAARAKLKRWLTP